MIPIPPRHAKKNLPALCRFVRSLTAWQSVYKAVIGLLPQEAAPRQWSLLRWHGKSFDPLTFDPAQMTPVASPPGTTWADPSLCDFRSEECLFLEEWPPEEPCAHLSAIRLGDSEELLTPPVRVIENGSHFSYPFTFEYENELWMLPENSSSGLLQLYRCEDFPLKWSADEILMQGVRYADPTLFQHNGKWWLFMTLGIGFHRANSDLFLFSADKPVGGSWIPHPMNPVAASFGNARMAGRIFRSNGKLYRPSQDCLKRYGHGLCINEIICLDENRYEEKRIRRIHPWNSDIFGVHGLDVSANNVFVDVLSRSRNS
jgi:hypothetical protein